MKINKKNIVIAVSMFALCFAVITAFADQENNFESPCEHSYEVVAFSDNTANLRCEHCGDEESVLFADYVGAENTDPDFEPLLDRNGDSIINGRDLAYLKTASY